MPHPSTRSSRQGTAGLWVVAGLVMLGSMWPCPPALAQSMPHSGQFGEAVEDDYEPPATGHERDPHAPPPMRLEAGEEQDLRRDAFTISDELPPAQAPRARRPSRVGRAFVELVGLVAGAAAGGLAGTIVSTPVVIVVDESGAERRGLIAMGAVVGAAMTAPLGVWVGGRLRHGNGSLPWTYVGALGGFWAFAALPAALDAKGTTVAGLGLVGFTLGGILAFELTSDADARDVDGPVVGRRISGGVTPLPGGVALTAMGTF